MGPAERPARHEVREQNGSRRACAPEGPGRRRERGDGGKEAERKPSCRRRDHSAFFPMALSSRGAEDAMFDPFRVLFVTAVPGLAQKAAKGPTRPSARRRSRKGGKRLFRRGGKGSRAHDLRPVKRASAPRVEGCSVETAQAVPRRALDGAGGSRSGGGQPPPPPPSGACAEVS